jgi:pimeloyl-ACP methyl ester carboxylesterase
LVLGGEKDYIFTPKDVEKTAVAYHTKAILFKDKGHNFYMSDEDGKIQQTILNFLNA